MTSANVLSLNSVGQTVNANAVSGQTKVKKAEEVYAFASLMNGNYAAANMQSGQTAVKGAAGRTASGDQLSDRYSYRENRIEPAQSTSIRDKISDQKEELESFAEDVVQTVAEDLQVGEDDVAKALEELGMTAFDLLIPQNLAQVASQITGEESPELLLNEQFVDLMQDMGQMGAQLLQTLDAEPDAMGELVAQMDILENPVELTDAQLQSLVGAKDAPGQEAKQADQPAEGVLPEEVLPEQAVPKAENAESFSGEEQAGDGWSGGNRQAKTSAGTGTDGNLQQADVAFHPVESVMEEMPVSEAGELSYQTIDTMDLIEQIAQNVRVSISEGTTSMEMQLNPENLGKIYLQISAKEGVVNANIAASNEAVRAALEAQVADLRQSLAQAGVKVDAIEVIVASHEFERNLEQNQAGTDPQDEHRQGQTAQRRNIRLSSMDELSGMMTEEEALVAQIMRDNGNSVDLTA